MTEPRATATGLRRGLTLLDVLSGEEAVRRGGLGVVAIARISGIDKSQVSRTLKTLAEHGLVERDPETLEYFLGWRLFAYAAVVGEHRLLQAAPLVLRRLVTRLGERSHLSVLEGDRVVTLLSESPPHAVQAAAWVGRPLPAWNTSSGRALLLDRTPAELAAFLGDADVPGGAGALAARIAEARGKGYAIVRDEFEEGLVGVAAPVRGPGRRIVAALNVSGPTFRFGTRLDVAGHEVAAAAARLSRELGGRPIARARAAAP
jgi:IclR family transcriptional regulator, KDG regulon repressor